MEIILQILALMKIQSLDRCKQISQFIADENGFGCVQNQSYWKMEIILQILELKILDPN
jgi:hypothetical protein